jgi:hypothetical protein
MTISAYEYVKHLSVLFKFHWAVCTLLVCSSCRVVTLLSTNVIDVWRENNLLGLFMFIFILVDVRLFFCFSWYFSCRLAVLCGDIVCLFFFGATGSSSAFS